MIDDNLQHWTISTSKELSTLFTIDDWIARHLQVLVVKKYKYQVQFQISPSKVRKYINHYTILFDMESALQLTTLAFIYTLFGNRRWQLVSEQPVSPSTFLV